MAPESVKMDVTYVDIHELMFHLEQDYTVKQFDPEKVRVTFNMDAGYNLEILGLGIDILVNYILIEGEKSHVLLGYHTRTDFEVKQLKDHIIEGIPTPNLLYPAVDIAMNMTRGMMAVRTLGTAYRSSLPPLVDPRALIAPYLQFQHEVKMEKEGD